MLKTATEEVVIPEAVLKAEYAAILICSNGLFNVRKNRKWGYVNAKGEEVAPFKYECPADFEDGVALVRYNREFYYVDEEGNESAI